MKINLRPHLIIRLQERHIPQNFVTETLADPILQYYDTSTRHLIAIKQFFYNLKFRPIVVVYDIIGLEVQVITVYPASEQEILNRQNNGRWRKQNA